MEELSHQTDYTWCKRRSLLTRSPMLGLYLSFHGKKSILDLQTSYSVYTPCTSTFFSCGLHSQSENMSYWYHSTTHLLLCPELLYWIFWMISEQGTHVPVLEPREPHEEELEREERVPSAKAVISRQNQLLCKPSWGLCWWFVLPGPIQWSSNVSSIWKGRRTSTASNRKMSG